jgi:predicted dithiol-disulfide oxidoreductase (DUF899 family)
MATSKLSPSGRTGHPEVVSREQWLKARKELLTREKELTKLYDGVRRSGDDCRCKSR